MSQFHPIEMCRVLAQSGFVLLLQSSLVLLLGLGLGTALRGRGALAQSAAFRATLCAVVCTALFSLFLSGRLHPVWRVSLPEAPRQAPFVAENTPPVSEGVTRETPPRQRPAAGRVRFAPPGHQSAVSPTPAAIPAPPPSVPWTIRVYIAIAALWAAGIVWLLGGIALGQKALHRLHRRSVPVESGRALKLRASPDVHSPFLAGVWRPVIYLPASYATDFDAEELKAIIAHEAAHLERRDVAWTLAARLTCALLWPQPLLWLLARRMELAAEEACDILALTQGCPPRVYADCLLSLAERLTPSRAERRLGLGVVPFRSQVGRRIQQILSGGPNLRPVSRGLRTGIAIAAIIAVVMGVCVIAVNREANNNHALADTTEQPHSWTAPDSYLAQFPSALPGGGAVQPIQILSIFDKTDRYPALLTDEDKTLVQQCKSVGFINTTYASGGPPVHDRKVLEAVLAKQPHFFYAEYLLGGWYKKSHDPVNDQLWTNRSLQDAPAILAGRVQFGDGKPVNGFTFSPTFGLYQSADSMDGLGYNDPGMLIYPDVTTDAKGCYFLPVFRAVYNLPGWGWSFQDQPTQAARRAAQMSMISPQSGTGGLSRFTVTSRVGVLPPFIARPHLTLGAPFRAANQDKKHPLRIAASAMTVTWPRYPGASQYEASLTEITLGPNGSRSETSLGFDGEDQHFNAGLPTTSLTLLLSGNKPVLFRNRLYALMMTASDADGNQLVDAQPYYFKPLAGIAPVPLTKAGLTRILPPGFTVTSVAKTAGGGVITGTMPEASNLDTLLGRNPFGWKSQKSRDWPLYAGGGYTGRNNFRLVYSNTGQVTSADVPSSTVPIGGVIVGRIRYADGKSAPGVPVIARMEVRSESAYLSQSLALGRRGAPSHDNAQGVSGADGAFRLGGLQKGHYDIIDMEKSGKWVAAAQTGIVIRGGETVHAPDLILTRGAVMTGTVIEKQTGHPIPGTNTGPFINALGPRYPASMGGSSSADVDSRGHYAIRLAPGKNWVYLSGGWESSNIDIDPMNNSNPKYPNYARGVYVRLREGETKIVPINAVREAPAH